MRSFTYNEIDGESFTTCRNEQNQILITVSFPTPVDAVHNAKDDFNFCLQELGLEPLTSEEVEAAKFAASL
jgi:hypothetical protein